MTITTSTWGEVERLHALGFAIILIHPKSKRPIESGWTTGERQSLKELKSKFKPSMNIGVRLGTPSKVGDGYLACIDVDVKDPAFGDEAMAKLAEIMGGKELPTVMSGGGNGSRHLYCVTSEPFKMVTVAKEKKKWEICIYSDGRQMVLPPSVHPDTAKTYRWGNNANQPFPLMDFSEWMECEDVGKETASFITESKSKNDFTFECDLTLDVRWAPKISDVVRTLIVKGIWKGKRVEDESAYLLFAASALLTSGYEKDEVLTILTDPTTVLGKCAYRHAGNTRNRNAAAKWLWRYTVKKAESEGELRKPVLAFTVEVGSDDSKSVISVGTRFYTIGAKGGLKPDYDELLAYFTGEKPFKMVADMKFVYVWNGTHYADFTDYEIKAYAETHFSPKPSDSMRTEFLNKVRANNVIRRNFFVDTTEGKLNFKNGVLDLNNEDGQLIASSPDIGFRGVLPYDYDPIAKCPFFWNWINDIMLGDKELVRILQEYMGYVIRGGEYRFHKALWLEGIGRNGKSTFIDVLKALIGQGNYSTVSIKSLIADKFMSSELDGKIANFSEETSPQELSDSGTFKNLTGDGDMSAQKKFGDPYSFRNRAKLIMTYNTIPDLKDLSSGMMSRPLIVPFRKKIKESEQDHQIKEKLFAELPGIFNFAFRGWKRLERQNAFTKSAHSEAALKNIKEESCNVYQWIENAVHFEPVVDNAPAIRTIDLYEHYRKHEKFPYKLIEFSKRMKAHPKTEGRWLKMTVGSVYKGISLGGQNQVSFDRPDPESSVIES